MTSPELTVDAPGPLVGEWADASHEIRVFRGIPYAAPPTGDLRWQPPLAVEPWTTPRSAERFGVICPQPPVKLALGKTSGLQDENCLTLNIWCPTPSSGAGLPVMVWIHGGGYTTGSSASPYYDGRHLARRGVVVVTLNYRLGVWGFLAHPALSSTASNGVSGNYGLLDQVAALTWVRDHIAAFGGDPHCVTVFGESAGGKSVSRLLVMPAAAGLFHRAIIQSGPAVGLDNPTLAEAETQGEQAVNRAFPEWSGQAVAGLAGKLRACDTNTLRRIVAAVGLFNRAGERGTKMGPVVDGQVIPQTPLRVLAEGTFHRVPVLLGANDDEGTMFLDELSFDRPAKWDRMLMRLFPTQASSIRAQLGVTTRETLASAMNTLVTHLGFVEPTRLQADLLTTGGVPVYLYQFRRVTPAARSRGLGAFHAAEIPYIFGTLPAIGREAEIDKALADMMASAWVSFARTGKPTMASGQSWPQYSPQNPMRWEFTDHSGPTYVDRTFWSEIFEHLVAEHHRVGRG